LAPEFQQEQNFNSVNVDTTQQTAGSYYPQVITHRQRDDPC